MDRSKNHSGALMSIRPRYASRILDGSKQVEFRRVAFARRPSWVLIYATAPIQKVVGVFEVAGIDEAEPHALWDKYRKVGGIELDDFARYFAGATVGVAIRVGRVRVFEKPLDLAAALGMTTPPQSFRYLPESALGSVYQ